MQSNISSGAAAPAGAPAAWGGVLAMALGAFALVSSEFMPVSLLTPVASDLRITEGQAGQSVAVSGAFALATSLFIARLAGGMDRKLLLMLLTALMVVSGTVAAFAPTYAIFMAGRALIGVAIGGFWSMSAATTMRLVPAHQLPKALAIVNGGNALAMVIAAPLGSFLGGLAGWRWAFFAIVPVAVIALCWKLFSLPAMKVERPATPVSLLALLRRPEVRLGMAAVSIFFMGQFTLFTYLRPFLETVARVDVATLSLMLLLLGAAGFVGTALIGRFLSDSGLYRTLVAIPVLMALVAVALVLVGSSVPAVAVLMGCWGLLATAAPVGWWTWLARTLPKDAEAGGGLIVAVVQLAIALGATTGGLLFDAIGYQATFGASALMLLLAALLAFKVARMQGRAPLHCDGACPAVG